MDTISKLFGSNAKVKVMRLFVFNPDTAFESKDVSYRARIPSRSARIEIQKFASIGLIKRKSFYKDSDTKRNGSGHAIKKRVQGWILDPKFELLDPLESFLIDAPPIADREIIRRANSLGRVRLIIVSGVFLQDMNSRVDILVVVDKFRKGGIEGLMRRVEADMGRELRYVSLTTDEFKYRLSMYDKLLRDILDFPHKTLMDRIGVTHFYSLKH